MATTRTFEIRSKQEASNIISAIHNHFFCNDNDYMVIEETEYANGNMTLVGWDNYSHYNDRNHPPIRILHRNKSDQTTNV